MRRTAWLVLVAVSACGGGGTETRREARTIHVDSRPVASGSAPGCLILLFPGLGDRPSAYADFLEILREHRVAAEAAVLPNRDYAATDYSDHLLGDVIAPARERGVEAVWLVGVSMGGAPALRMAESHPDDVEGVVLLAPVFGSPFVAKRVRRAGGASAYQPAPGDRDGRAFRWLANRRRSDGSRVRVRLGYGRQDSLAPVSEIIARVLPEKDVLVGAGGHDWAVWNELFGAMVGSGFLQRSCGVVR